MAYRLNGKRSTESRGAGLMAYWLNGLMGNGARKHGSTGCTEARKLAYRLNGERSTEAQKHGVHGGTGCTEARKHGKHGGAGLMAYRLNGKRSTEARRHGNWLTGLMA